MTHTQKSIIHDITMDIVIDDVQTISHTSKYKKLELNTDDNLDDFDLSNTSNDGMINVLKNDSDKLHTQFEVLGNLSEYDKLAIDNNILYKQIISPWRYIVRKFKKQNRIVLSKYLNIEINNYTMFIRKLCDFYKMDKKNAILHEIIVKHLELTNDMSIVFKFLRDKYNMKSNSSEISLALENSLVLSTKNRFLLLDAIANN
jgi:hypothetical protein